MGGAQQSKFYTDPRGDDDNYGGITTAANGEEDLHNEMLTRYISIDPFVHFNTHRAALMEIARSLNNLVDAGVLATHLCEPKIVPEFVNQFTSALRNRRSILVRNTDNVYDMLHFLHAHDVPIAEVTFEVDKDQNLVQPLDPMAILYCIYELHPSLKKIKIKRFGGDGEDGDVRLDKKPAKEQAWVTAIGAAIRSNKFRSILPDHVESNDRDYDVEAVRNECREKHVLVHHSPEDKLLQQTTNDVDDTSLSPATEKIGRLPDSFSLRHDIVISVDSLVRSKTVVAKFGSGNVFVNYVFPSQF